MLEELEESCAMQIIYSSECYFTAFCYFPTTDPLIFQIPYSGSVIADT